jgi:hypothetical protein
MTDIDNIKNRLGLFLSMHKNCYTHNHSIGLDADGCPAFFCGQTSHCVKRLYSISDSDIRDGLSEYDFQRIATVIHNAKLGYMINENVPELQKTLF